MFSLGEGWAGATCAAYEEVEARTPLHSEEALRGASLQERDGPRRAPVRWAPAAAVLILLALSCACLGAGIVRSHSANLGSSEGGVPRVIVAAEAWNGAEAWNAGMSAYDAPASSSEPSYASPDYFNQAPSSPIPAASSYASSVAFADTVGVDTPAPDYAAPQVATPAPEVPAGSSYASSIAFADSVGVDTPAPAYAAPQVATPAPEAAYGDGQTVKQEEASVTAYVAPPAFTVTEVPTSAAPLEVALEGPADSKSDDGLKTDMQAQALHTQATLGQMAAASQGAQGGSDAASDAGSHGRRHAPGSVQAANWVMCSGVETGGKCDEHTLESWTADPTALAAAVPEDLSALPGMQNKVYEEVIKKWKNTPPHFKQEEVSLEDIASFMKDLLSSDPFGTGDQVPFVDFSGLLETKGGQVVAITQRQLAFLVANVLMGNGISANDGLSAALFRCGGQAVSGYIYSLLSFLGVLSKEIGSGEQGTFLVATSPMGPLREDVWRERLGTSTLSKPELCTNIGGNSTCPVNDFMEGGVYNQALTDIAGRVVGGGGELCDLAYSQDESLVQFYPETLAFSFFAISNSMIYVPWTLMGARRYLSDFSGETSVQPPFTSHCGLLKDEDWLNEGILTKTEEVVVAGTSMTVASSAFVAVASEPTDGCDDRGAKNNNCDRQRRHVDEDIALWYQAFEPSQYNPAVQDAFRGLVFRIGTGPWGAGAWWGDSQQSFLTVWLATSLISGRSLDYYIYDHFCENPANQCFVLGGKACKQCIEMGESGDENGPEPERCGKRSIQDIVKEWEGKSTQDLYDKLLHIPGPPAQVFDVL